MVSWVVNSRFDPRRTARLHSTLSGLREGHRPSRLVRPAALHSFISFTSSISFTSYRLRTLLRFLALFCTQQKLIPFLFMQFRTLRQKTTSRAPPRGTEKESELHEKKGDEFLLSAKKCKK